jgi:hypothetical protein
VDTKDIKPRITEEEDIERELEKETQEEASRNRV